MNKKKYIEKNENIEVENKKETKKLKINYKKTKIPPYYLRINITKFKNFKDASNLKEKMNPINNKVLISLSLLNGQKYYKVTTVPIKNIKEADYFLSVIQKNDFNNAKLFIERKKK